MACCSAPTSVVEEPKTLSIRGGLFDWEELAEAEKAASVSHKRMTKQVDNEAATSSKVPQSEAEQRRFIRTSADEMARQAQTGDRVVASKGFISAWQKAYQRPTATCATSSSNMFGALRPTDDDTEDEDEDEDEAAAESTVETEEEQVAITGCKAKAKKGPKQEETGFDEEGFPLDLDFKAPPKQKRRTRAPKKPAQARGCVTWAARMAGRARLAQVRSSPLRRLRQLTRFFLSQVTLLKASELKGQSQPRSSSALLMLFGEVSEPNYESCAEPTQQEISVIVDRCRLFFGQVCRPHPRRKTAKELRQSPAGAGPSTSSSANVESVPLQEVPLEQSLGLFDFEQLEAAEKGSCSSSSVGHMGAPSPATLGSSTVEEVKEVLLDQSSGPFDFELLEVLPDTCSGLFDFDLLEAASVLEPLALDEQVGSGKEPSGESDRAGECTKSALVDEVTGEGPACTETSMETEVQRGHDVTIRSIKEPPGTCTGSQEPHSNLNDSEVQRLTYPQSTLSSPYSASTEAFQPTTSESLDSNREEERFADIRIIYGAQEADYVDLRAEPSTTAKMLLEQAVSSIAVKLSDRWSAAETSRWLRTRHLACRSGVIRDGRIGCQAWFFTSHRTSLSLCGNHDFFGGTEGFSSAASDDDEQPGGAVSSGQAPQSGGLWAQLAVQASGGDGEASEVASAIHSEPLFGSIGAALWRGSRSRPQSATQPAQGSLQASAAQANVQAAPGDVHEPLQDALNLGDGTLVEETLGRLRGLDDSIEPELLRKVIQACEEELKKPRKEADEDADGTAAAPTEPAQKASPQDAKVESLLESASGLKVMAWNLQALTFATNPLEFAPAAGVLSDANQQAYDNLMQEAEKILLDATTRIGDFIGESFLEDLCPEAKAPLELEEKQHGGLAAFLESRRAKWPEAWGEMGAAEAASKFLEDYESRWQFWRQQSILEFLSDDQSGGKRNERLPADGSSIDELCWDLGLSSADRRFAKFAGRRSAHWLVKDFVTKKQEPTQQRNCHDLFKLLVWDAITAKVLATALPEHSELLTALRPLSQDERVKRIAERVTAVDVAILLEFPVGPHPLRTRLEEEGFHIATPTLTEEELVNSSFVTAIVAKRSIFKNEPHIKLLRDRKGNAFRRLLSVQLTRSEHLQAFSVLGVHLSGREDENEEALEYIEAALDEDTMVLGGDFNIDLRVDQGFAQDVQHPKFAAFFQQVKKVSADVASTHKTRTPFQAQVTKMLLPDTTAKDYLLVSPALGDVTIEGYIKPDKGTSLPNGEVPSDHAPLTATLPIKSGANPYMPIMESLGGQAAIDKFKERSEQIRKMLAKRAKSSEPWRHDRIYHHLPLETLVHVGKTQIRPMFVKILGQLEERWKDLGVKAVVPQCKGISRARTKCRIKYGADPSQVTDIVRATLTIPKDEQGVAKLYELLERLVYCPELCGGGRRLVFLDDRWQRSLGSSGYRDMLLLVKIANYTCELQINFQEVVDIKQGADGHAVYERERLLQDALIYACMMNQPKEVRRALQKGAPPNGPRDMYGFASLHYGAQHGNEAIVEQLLQKGANPLLLDNEGCLAITRAAALGHWGTVLRLVAALQQALKSTDPVTLKGNLKRINTSALAEMVQAALEAERDGTLNIGNCKEVITLARDLMLFRDTNVWSELAREACVTAWELLGRNPDVADLLGPHPKKLIDEAIGSGAQRIVKDLHEQGCRLSEVAWEEENPWLRGILESDEFLLSKAELQGCEEEREEKLREAVERPNLRMVRACTASGVRMPVAAVQRSRYPGRSALRMALEKVLEAQHESDVEDVTEPASSELKQQQALRHEILKTVVRHSNEVELLQRDEDLATVPHSVFALKDKGLLTELCQELLPKSAILDEKRADQRTVLHLAAEQGLSDLVESLVSSGVQLNSADASGRTPLLLAAEHGHGDAMVQLMRARARLQQESPSPKRGEEKLDGSAALLLAVESNNTRVVELLIQLEVPLDGQNADGRTPLACAAKLGHSEAMLALLSARADINQGSLMHIAAEHGQLTAIDTLLHSGAGINAAASDGSTPVIAAAKAGQVDALTHLVELGADTTQALLGGRTLLHHACDSGQPSVVELLLHSGADIDKADHAGATPFLLACKKGHEAVVRLLLESRASLEKADRDGETALNMAARSAHGAVVQLLLDARADVTRASSDGWSSLHAASDTGLIEAARQLIQLGCGVNMTTNDGETPLHRAGHPEVAELLLRGRAEVNKRANGQKTPVYTAATSGRAEVLQVLINSRADIEASDGDSRTPLWSASDNGRIEAVQILLANRAKIDAAKNNGCTPLFIASENGHPQVVDALVAARANVEAAMNDGATPLYIASAKGHPQVVDALVAARANVEAAMKDGFTPLYVASEKGHLQVVDALVAARANVETAQKNGCTPLYIASENGHLQVVDALLAAGANTEAAEGGGWAALQTASDEGHQKVVESLLAAGAKINRAIKSGRTALRIATDKKHLEVVAVLRQHGARE